jgi:hypothetical protein
MDERQPPGDLAHFVASYTEARNTGDLDRIVGAYATPCFVVKEEMPQSGERIRGQDNLRAFRVAYPKPPTIQPRRLIGAGNLWVVEAARTDDGGPVYVVAVIEFRDGRIWRDTRWFGDPFEAPAWRAQWVERIEEAPAPDATCS